MKPTRVTFDGEKCVPWQGDAAKYQKAAANSFSLDGFIVREYSWIVTMCGTNMCLTTAHLRVNEPVRIDYPRGVCIYCGRPGHTRDHLMPRNWTGEGAARSATAVVPACGMCNSLIGDALTWTIQERRELCHSRIRRKFRKVLATKDWTDEELHEFGPMLRNHILDAMASKAEVMRMLRWPTDRAYDLRALEKSGIDDAARSGLAF